VRPVPSDELREVLAYAVMSRDRSELALLQPVERDDAAAV
jgi:hypothetical protein